MITKGKIINKILNSNKYLVRLPIFEQAGIDPKSNVFGSSIFEATLCYNPGTFESYKPNDIVYVGFEDGSPDKPIILGKLYLGTSKTGEAFQFNNSLEVDKSVLLPEDVKINNIPLDEYISNNKAVKNNSDKINVIEVSRIHAKLISEEEVK